LAEAVEGADVRAEDLRKDQVERLKASLGRQLRYLHKLRRRMDKRGWDPACPVYRAAQQAFNAMHTLNVQLHYASQPKGKTGK
jgi:hypothetical protein